MITERTRDMLKMEVDLTTKKAHDKPPVYESNESTSAITASNEGWSNAMILSRSPSSLLRYPKKVSFSTLEIREYGIIPGDNPAVTGGCPLSIDWVYDSVFTCSVENYEEVRPKTRSMTELRIPSREREETLRRVGFSRRDIQEGTKNANITRHQRRRTEETMKLAPVQEFLERAKRKTLHLVGAGMKRKERELMRNFTAGSASEKSPANDMSG